MDAAQCAGSWLQFPGVACAAIDSFPLLGLLSLGTALAISAGQAAPFPTRSSQLGPELQITLVREREAAAVTGALVGGAVGVLSGRRSRARLRRLP